MKVTFTRIDNGYRCLASYEASNGLEILHHEKDDTCYHGYDYSVWNGSTRLGDFDYLKEAKEFCMTYGEPKAFKKWLTNDKAEKATFRCRLHHNGEVEYSVYFLNEDVSHDFETEQEAIELLTSKGFHI